MPIWAADEYDKPISPGLNIFSSAAEMVSRRLRYDIYFKARLFRPTHMPYTPHYRRAAHVIMCEYFQDI